MKFIVKVALFLLIVNTLDAQQWWRDSATYTIPSPSGKKVRFTQISIGDTNVSKVSGTLAYMNSGFFVANGSYFQQMGTTVSNDTATYVTKGSTQVVTSPKFWTARQYMTSLNVDTIQSRTANNSVFINDSVVIDNGLSVGRGNSVVSPNGGNFTVGKNNTVSSFGQVLPATNIFCPAQNAAITSSFLGFRECS